MSGECGVWHSGVKSFPTSKNLSKKTIVILFYRKYGKLAKYSKSWGFSLNQSTLFL
jgi:hypothetical protein